MRGQRSAAWDEGQHDLFVSPERAARGFDLAALPSLELAETSDPVQLLRQLHQRTGDLLAHISDTHTHVLDAGGVPGRTTEAAAIATVDACARVASLAYAQQLRAIALVHDGSDTLLTADDATPGASRSSVATDASNVAANVPSSGRYPSRASLTASMVGPVLGLSAAGSHGHVRRALALRERMPNARQRLIDGDWGEFHLALAMRDTARLDDDSMRELDAALHTQHGRISPARVSSRIDSWLTRHGVVTQAEDDRESGVEARRVWFGPVDLFGMRTMGAYLRAIDVTALQTALGDIAGTAAKDDPRTRDQIVADTFMALFTGPAALAPAVAHQLGMSPPRFAGADGYVTCDDAQSAETASVWETVRMLLATVDLTTCRPPQAHIDLTVPLQTLLELKAGLTPGHPDNELDRLAAANGLAPPGDPPEVGPGTEPELMQEPPDTTLDATAERDPRAVAAGIGTIPNDVLLLLVSQDVRMRRVLLGPVHSQPINHGSSRYVPSRSMAARVRGRDKRCRFPGCTRPATRPGGRDADLDHVVAHRADGTGGQTADAGLIVLCREHHKIKHDTAWTPVLHDDGSVTWRNNHLGLTLVTRPDDWP